MKPNIISDCLKHQRQANPQNPQKIQSLLNQCTFEGLNKFRLDLNWAPNLLKECIIIAEKRLGSCLLNSWQLEA